MGFFMGLVPCTWGTGDIGVLYLPQKTKHPFPSGLGVLGFLSASRATPIALEWVKLSLFS